MSREEFLKAHQVSDTDAEKSALHHTLGLGPNQAARGNHNHAGTYATVDHVHPYAAGGIGSVIMHMSPTPPTTEYLALNGQVIQRVDYPDLFVLLTDNSAINAIALPDYRGKFPVGSNGTFPVNTTGTPGTNQLTKTTQVVQSGTGDTVLKDITEPAGGILPPWVGIYFYVKAT